MVDMDPAERIPPLLVIKSSTGSEYRDDSTKAATDVPIGQAEGFYRVAHSIPGRLRLSVDQLKGNPELAQQLAGAAITQPGVTNVRVNRLAASLLVEYDVEKNDESALLIALRGTDLSLVTPVDVPNTPVAKVGLILERAVALIEKLTPPVVQFGLGTTALVASLLGLPVSGPLAILASVPILTRALDTAVTERRISVDGLDGLAAVLMIAYRNFRSASFMIALIALGEFIREMTSNRCKKIIGDLLGLAGRSAWLVKGKKRICIPADQVKFGDTIVIYPGEMVPVDGLIVQGEGSVNQASLTGEAIPAEVKQGTTVYAATVLVVGQIYVRCTATLTNSRASQVIDLVNAAPLHETKIQNYASLMADKAVVPIIGSALLCLLMTKQVTRMISMLVYDFSTGIRIAAPTGVLACMARAGRRGILIKSGGALERLAHVNAIIFDKTGTLTLGKPSVTEIFQAAEYTPDEVLAFAAAVEMRLSHPAAEAIVKEAHNRGLQISTRTGASHSMGMGVEAIVDDKRVLVGSRRLMESQKLDLVSVERYEKIAGLRGDSLAYIAIEGKIAGLLAYSDTIRPETPEMIRKLHRRGIKRIVMATGDNQLSAQRIANAAGVDQIFAGAFPEHKAQLVKQLKEEGYVVAVVGDGINDSPALAHADVAISLRGGTDAAREHADVVLTDDDLLRLPEAVDIARGAMGLVRETMALVAIPNGVGIVLTAFGIVGPAGATLLNNGSAIVAALNALRPLMSPGWTKLRKSEVPSIPAQS